MRRTFAFFLVAGSILLSACQQQSGKDAHSPPEHPKDTKQTLHQADISYAKRFQITYYDSYKVISINNPWPNADKRFQYVLYQRGTEKPSGYGNAWMIEIPLQKLACLSSTCLSFAIELDILDKLVAVSELESITHTGVIEKVRNGQIKEVGQNANVNVEILLEMAPLLVATYGVGKPEYDSHPILKDAGIPVAVHAEYMENTPLGRAEWIKFMAAFFNLENEAEEIFRETEMQYDQLVTITEDVTNRPSVVVGKNRGGTWWMSGGRSYMANFLKDAGAHYLWADDTTQGSMMLSYEAVYDKAVQADYWVVNVGRWNTIEDAIKEDDRYNDLQAVRLGNVYDNTGSINEHGANNYWEKGVAKPHLILNDLIKIFHPGLLPEHQLVFYRNLKKADNQ